MHRCSALRGLDLVLEKRLPAQMGSNRRQRTHAVEWEAAPMGGQAESSTGPLGGRDAFLGRGLPTVNGANGGQTVLPCAPSFLTDRRPVAVRRDQSNESSPSYDDFSDAQGERCGMPSGSRCNHQGFPLRLGGPLGAPHFSLV